MTKSLIVAIAAVAGSTPIIAMQYLEISKLKEESASLRDKLESRVVPQRDRPNASGNSGAKAPKKKDGLESGDLDLSTSPNSIKAILRQSDPASRMQAMLAYMETLDLKDIPDALMALRQGAPKWDQEAKFFAHMLLTRWGKDDPDAAFASLTGIGMKDAGGSAASILGGLAATDPKRAIAWLEDPANKYANLPWMGHILAGTIAKEWVRQDADAALEWASALPDSQRRGALGGIIESLATSDPERASVMAMELDPKDRGDLIGNIARSWAERSPDEALRWAETLEGNDRRTAVGQALSGLAQSSPAEAAAYFDALKGDTEGVSLGEIAGAWAQRAPADAAQWVVGQEESEGKNDGMRRLMLTWTASDPQAASQWIDAQPASDSRDHGIGMLAFSAFQDDPESAITWAAAMTNPEMRATSVEKGVHEWMRRDPEAAREWVNNTNILTSDERTGFLAPREGERSERK